MRSAVPSVPRRPALLVPLCLLAVAALLAAAPAGAAIHYRATTSIETEGQEPQRTEVEAWVDGPNAKIVFAESGAPMLEAGQYLLSRDGGQTLYLVDPEEKTYAEWDLDAMLQAVGAIMQSIQPLVNLTIDGVEVTPAGSEPGGEIHGLPTTHSTWRTSYDLTIKVFGMGRASHVESVQETWSTTELSDAGLGIWLRNAPATGFSEIDELVAAEMRTLQGFPLKTVTSTTTTGQKGKTESTSRRTMEVTSLDRAAPAPEGGFEVPAGYSPVEMASEEGAAPENPLSGLFGGGKKN